MSKTIPLMHLFENIRRNVGTVVSKRKQVICDFRF